MKDDKMTRTKNQEPLIDKLSIVQRMKHHIHAHNTRMNYLHMSKLTVIELLNNCHPSDRVYYAQELHKKKLISKKQLQSYTNPNLKNYSYDEQETIDGPEGENRLDEVRDFFPEG